MKFNRADIKRIVREETLQFFGKMLQTENNHQIVDAHADKPLEKEPQDSIPKPKFSHRTDKNSEKPTPVPLDTKSHDVEDPSQFMGNPEDNDQDDVSEPSKDGAEADSKGKGVGDQVLGKSILGLTDEPNPKSGKKEIVVQFKDDENPLRIIVQPNGTLQYAYGGQLYDKL